MEKASNRNYIIPCSCSFFIVSYLNPVNLSTSSKSQSGMPDASKVNLFFNTISDSFRLEAIFFIAKDKSSLLTKLSLYMSLS